MEQLGRVTPNVWARNMFGGVGIYAGECFFALIADDVLYFKVDDSTRPTYVTHGMEPFRPFGDDGMTMQYYRVPEELLEEPEALRPWATDAIGVAQRAKRIPRRRRGG